MCDSLYFLSMFNVSGSPACSFVRNYLCANSQSLHKSRSEPTSSDLGESCVGDIAAQPAGCRVQSTHTFTCLSKITHWHLPTLKFESFYTLTKDLHTKTVFSHSSIADAASCWATPFHVPHRIIRSFNCSPPCRFDYL